MNQLAPYIVFNGRCREALEFYKTCFSQAELSIRTFAEAATDDMSEEAKSAVMHAEFKVDGLLIMATDGQPGMPFTAGNNIHLNLLLESVEEQTELFDKLSTDGQVVMALQDTFWQSRFGMLTDKFGIQWMLNVPLG